VFYRLLALIIIFGLVAVANIARKPKVQMWKVIRNPDDVLR